MRWHLFLPIRLRGGRGWVCWARLLANTMENWIHELVVDLPLWGLFAVIALALYAVAKGADLLVQEAVALSERWGVPKVVIGATIVSLGTTLPEAAVSVMAALKGNPALALGNAVGSIITDCGLILGIAALLSPLPLDRRVVNRQGWIQIGTGFALVLLCFPWMAPSTVFSGGGNLPQWAGFLFVAVLVLYLVGTVFDAKRSRDLAVEVPDVEAGSTGKALLMLLAGLVLVLAASHVLIPTVEITALRLGVPDAIIAATLVAFGTSLPELVTAVTAVRRGHGELAIGNVIGADILNVLFVAGLSAAVTPGGLDADPRFFWLLFPGMIALLVVFRVGIFFQRERLGRRFGMVLLGIYFGVTVLSYLL